MQRNMDLVRTILTRLESNPDGRCPPHYGIIGYMPEQIAYHAHIMMQDGLIETADIASCENSGPDSVPTTLTWKGHEFLDLARDQARWNRAKAIVAKVGGAPISIWMKVLTDLMLQGVDAAAAKAS